MRKPLSLNDEAFVVYPRLRRLKRFVEENYRQPISLERAAEQVGLERTHFSTFFQQKAGMGFSQWLSYTRIKRATEILETENHPTSRLAEIVGFEDLPTFDRAFKKITGMTPSKYKKNLLLDNASRAVGDPSPGTGYLPGEIPNASCADGDLSRSETKSDGQARKVDSSPELLRSDTRPEYLRDRSVTRYELERELRQALERRELQVHYQPIVALRDGRIAGLEALIRWDHPSYGLLLPEEFLNLALRAGLLRRIDLWVLAEACRQLASWRSQSSGANTADLTVSVNIEAAHLTVPSLADEIQQILDSAGLTPDAIKLEITESTVLQRSSSALATIAEFEYRGIGLHIDDFGTGYSCLSCLHQLPAEALKIDRSFIASMLSSRVHGEIVRSITGLANNLGIKVIAEGVETEDQLDYLNELGCDYAQGFLFSEPIQTDAARELNFSQEVLTVETLGGG